jgi:hypothetical protein
MVAKKKLFKNIGVQQKVALYLLEKGAKRVETKSRRYMCFKNQDNFYFLGANGAVRVNNYNAAGGSRSVTGLYKKYIKTWEKFKDPKQWIELQPLYYFED